jgi:hypothetical protein
LTALPAPVSLSNGANPQSASLSFGAAGSNASVLASANAGAGDGGYAQASGGVIYYFTIISPTGTTPASSVPIVVSGSSTQSVLSQTSSQSQTFTSFAVSGAPGTGLPGNLGGQQIICAPGTNISGCGTLSYQISGTVSSFAAASTNNPTYSGYIELSAYAFASPGIPYCAADSASAYIDPYISIDPTFLVANPGCSIVVSNGIGNSPVASATPEPSSFALTGLAALGLVGMQRKRNRK